MTSFFEKLSRSRSLGAKLSTLLKFRLHFLKPVIGVMQGLTDPVSGLIMGLTAENLAREFHITRLQQDEFALKSHQKAVTAQKNGIFSEEIIPVPLPKDFTQVMEHDEGPRENQTMEALGKLRQIGRAHV